MSLLPPPGNARITSTLACQSKHTIKEELDDLHASNAVVVIGDRISIRLRKQAVGESGLRIALQGPEIVIHPTNGR